MDNKTIAKLLRKAVEDSKYQAKRWGNMNGFEVIVGEDWRVCPNKLSAKINMIADMLDEV